ncbi:hypothetical protein [Mannheimia haemolytica]|uniref:hypothetical protein n=1 Tax=Mannheimia haemolytica TaxID=75985 RepID=UPI001EFEF60C|nr:hypothetical protein [Mannheimia haemolytica]
MRVYFKKSNLKEYVIWPVPTNTKDYYQVEVDSESDLYGKTAVKQKMGLYW